MPKCCYVPVCGMARVAHLLWACLVWHGLLAVPQQCPEPWGLPASCPSCHLGTPQRYHLQDSSADPSCLCQSKQNVTDQHSLHATVTGHDQTSRKSIALKHSLVVQVSEHCVCNCLCVQLPLTNRHHLAMLQSHCAHERCCMKSVITSTSA